MEPFKLVINRKIDRWDEGIPLGNGEVGCLVFGSSKKLVFALDRGDIWDRSNSPEHTPGFLYENLVRWAKSGNTKAIKKTFDVPYSFPTPTKLPTGRIEIVLGNDLNNDCFELDLKKAECKYSAGDVWVKSYTHATNGIGMIKTNSRQIQASLVNPKFGKQSKYDSVLKKLAFRDAVSNKLKNVKYPQAKFDSVTLNGIHINYFVQKLNDGGCFGIAVGKKENGSGCEFSYYPYYCKNETELISVIVDKVEKALNMGYDSLFNSHEEWWKEYNSKSTVCVPDSYIQNRYNMGNYLLGAASRKGCYPMPLQGVWTACDDKFLPPWKGDYHHDLNTQMTYYSYLKANRLEQGQCFLDYLASLKDRAKEFATQFYGASGICLPSVMDIDGHAMGGWAMYSLSPTNQLWLCQAFERYYSYTGNSDFLRETAYPYMEQSAKFVLSLMEQDKDGFLVLPLSSSPEMHDNTIKSFLTPNSNYDQSMLIYIFTALSKLADVLEKTDDKFLWESSLKRLRPLAVNEKNVLRISNDEDLMHSHRHQSHAMAIHPLRILDYNTDSLIIDATNAYTESLGSKEYTGYSMAWLGELFTVAKNGDKALEYLEIFWKCFCSINTFHLNGDYTKQGYSDLNYRPFTLEGNFCANDVLQEMLIYSENGIIELFPALPKKWKDVSFTTLRAWGGVLVSAKLCQDELDNASFIAENDVEFLLRGGFQNVLFEGGKTTTVENGVKVTLSKGETLFVSK